MYSLLKVVGTNQVVIKTRSLTQDEREALQNALVEKFGVDESLFPQKVFLLQ